MAKIPLHMIASTELRPALTINCDISPKVQAWFQELLTKGKSVSVTRGKKGTVIVSTPDKTLESRAQFLQIVNLACSVPKDARYTSTLSAQKNQETAGIARKRTGKEQEDRVSKKKTQRIMESEVDSDPSY
jgi:hypothetical protein